MSSVDDSPSLEKNKYLQRKDQLAVIFYIALSVFALVSIVFQICSLIADVAYSYVVTGIWCGAFYGVTAIVGFISIGKGFNKKIKWALCTLALLSSACAIVLVTLSALGLEDKTVGSESNRILGIVSNSVLIAMGIMGLITSLSIVVVTALSYKPAVKLGIIEEIKEVGYNQHQPKPEAFPKYPPFDVVAFVKHKNEAGGTVSGMYELTEPPRLSDKTDSDGSSYAVPFESKATLKYSQGDFEIQVDNRQTTLKINCERRVNDEWIMNPAVLRQENRNTEPDSDEEGWNTIEIPKEDILIHAPPSSPPIKNHINLNSTRDHVSRGR